MPRKTKVVHPEKDWSQIYKEGNRIIDDFMVSANWQDYHTSWDVLMSAIRKIKERVYEEGYDMFMPEHCRYAAIGNACYDADLKAAWLGVVRWVTLRNHLQSFRVEEQTMYKTNNRSMNLSVSPHATYRWKQRINESTTVDEICETLANEKLYWACKVNGDGVYYIGNGLAVVVDNFKIITTYKYPFDGEGVYVKVKELDYAA
jgi:hypothetical protein